MATEKFMLPEYPWDQRYRVDEIAEILTPALLVYPEIIERNISLVLRLLAGDANRWRVHVKTAKLGYTLRTFVERGVYHFKCATTIELLVACRSGATDVLFAYPAVGANARRVGEISELFPGVRVSALAENEEQISQWKASRVGLFLDLNPGMNRTGIDDSQQDKIVSLVRAVAGAKLEFRGLHYYDGQ